MSVRLEYSKSKRAGCKAPECKTQGIKIDKGELRHCTFVSFGDNQSWIYRHWGCVTPRQIANLKTAIEGNLDYLDGYDELTDEDKDKVRQALADGHVADEDWRYDIEMNRPGKNGFRSPANKAAMRAEKTSDEQHQSESPSKPRPEKKRSRIKKTEDSEAEAEEPKPKKSKARKVKIENASEAEANEPKPKKSRAGPTMVKKEDSNVVGEPEEIQSKKPKASVRRVKKEQHSEAENAPDAKSKRTRAAPAKLKKEMIDDIEESDAIPPSKKTRAPHKKGAAGVERRPSDEEDGHASEPGSGAKAVQGDESDSAFESVDKRKATNGRIKKESRSAAAKALSKKEDALNSTKRVTRSLKA